ncbi:MAG: hypothetical protein HC901_02435, partial [Bdellovibrionaceae bacterium]|nr:hypothetical protein [Pseudobdellovibrionaceae bacterium]
MSNLEVDLGSRDGEARRPEPSWSRSLRGFLVLAACAALMVGTALHWGGVYEHFSLRLAPAVVVLSGVCACGRRWRGVAVGSVWGLGGRVG